MNRDGLFPGSDGNVYAGWLYAVVAYNLQCSKCDRDHEITYRLNPGGCLPWPDLPEGWQWVGDRLICPKHRVRVEDVPEPRRRVIWKCPHCPYRWGGETSPKECPSCGSACPFVRTEEMWCRGCNTNTATSDQGLCPKCTRRFNLDADFRPTEGGV